MRQVRALLMAVMIAFGGIAAPFMGTVQDASAATAWNCSLGYDIYNTNGYSAVQGWAGAWCSGSGYKSMYACLYDNGVLQACQSVSTWNSSVHAYPTDWSCYFEYGHSYRLSLQLSYGGVTRYTNYYEVVSANC